MADAKICDRCRKLYEWYNVELVSSSNNHPKLYGHGNGIIFEQIGYGGSNIKGSDTIDLCPECFNDLMDWFLKDWTVVKDNGN